MKKFFVLVLLLFCAGVVSAQVMINGRPVKNGQVKLKFDAENREALTLFASVGGLDLSQFDFEWSNDAGKIISDKSQVSIPLVFGFQYYTVYLIVVRKDQFFSEGVKIILKAERRKIKIDYN